MDCVKLYFKDNLVGINSTRWDVSQLNDGSIVTRGTRDFLKDLMEKLNTPKNEQQELNAEEELSELLNNN